MTTFRGGNNPVLAGDNLFSQQDLANAIAEVQEIAEDAETSKDEAATSATNAAASASSASSSASSAESDVESFFAVYYGSAASDPATDPNGDAVSAGDVYFNTTSGKLQVYSGAVWEDFSAPDAAVYDINFSVYGTAPAATTQIGQLVATRGFKISGTASIHQGYAKTGPTGSNTTVTIYVEGVSKGSVTFTTAGGNGQTQAFSLTETTVSAGDVVSASVTTGDVNSVIADLSITVYGTVTA